MPVIHGNDEFEILGCDAAPYLTDASPEFQSLVGRLGSWYRGCSMSKVVLHHHTQHHGEPAYVSAFITMALPGALAANKKWGVPIAVLLAQSAQETGWGRHVVKNAYFGIKGRAPDGKSVEFATTEVVGGKVIHEKDGFRAYDGFSDAADDFGRYLSENSRYKSAFAFKHDPEKFAVAVARAGYATDPDYAKSLVSIIRSHHLAHYDTLELHGK